MQEMARYVRDGWHGLGGKTRLAIVAAVAGLALGALLL